MGILEKAASLILVITSTCLVIWTSDCARADSHYPGSDLWLPHLLKNEIHRDHDDPNTGAIVKELRKSDVSNSSFRFDAYHTLQEITDWLESVAVAHPDVVSLVEISRSWEGRPLVVVKISAPPTLHTGSQSKRITKKPAIWLDGGIHSNEWIAPATLLYYVNELVARQPISGPIRDFLERYDCYVMPVFNVDGYAYTWTHDRLWRKSRSVHRVGSEVCIGVDLNRNWPSSKSVAVNQTCDNLYPGPYALSEPEVAAVVNFFRQNSDAILIYVAYHGFSQYWMTPYAHSTNQRPRNFQQLNNLSLTAVDAVAKVHGLRYKTGSVADLIGTIGGSSIDYVYDVLGIPYAFGVELRDRGEFGTLLPADQIIPTAEETLAGLLALGRNVPR